MDRRKGGTRTAEERERRMNGERGRQMKKKRGGGTKEVDERMKMEGRGRRGCKN